MELKQFRFYSQTGNIRKIQEYLLPLSDSQKLEHLRSVLQTPLRSDVLEYFGTVIARLPFEMGTSLLIELFYSEEAAVRNMAIELFEAYGPKALDVLKLHLNDMDADARMFTLQAAIRLPYRAQVLELLKKQLLQEKDINILGTIVEALGDLGDGRNEAEAIIAVLETYPHPYLSFVAKRSLQRLGVSVNGTAHEEPQ